MNTNWKKIVEEDEKLQEFVKEITYLIAVNIEAEKTLPLLYGFYQSGQSAKESFEILRNLIRMQDK